VYNLPIISQLILLLHWVLVTLSDFFAPLGYRWQWGLAIIGLTIIVRLILFPLTWKQYKSAQQMQVIQPEIKELQKKYKNDRAKLQEETMKLYSEHRVNPFASCLPLLLQLPVFIALYAAIKGVGPLDAPQYKVSVEALSNAPFLWLPHLGLPDPYYILLILYVATQMISTELMVATQSDQTQKWIMRAMPIMFVLFLFRFPSGLFVYWVTTNIWTIGQQLIIRRTMPKPEELAAQAKARPPKKRSRFMEALVASQQEAAKQREQRLAEKGGQGGQGKAGGGSGKRPQQGAKKAAPPGKGKRKPGQGQSAKPGQSGAKPGQSAKPKGQGGQRPQQGGQPRKPRPSGEGQSGGSPGGAAAQGTNTSAGGPADD
jgi:YidC/Oxa1 family membrane protein insertase